MQALVEITRWHWAGFIACVVIFLALDLGVFHREAGLVKFREALGWTTLWGALALMFAALLALLRGRREAVEFFTGYFIELSLSMDNVFVIALIFASFRVPAEYQHRLLFWGVLGALAMRGLLIWLGMELINRFDWLLYILGGFLILTGFRMLVSRGAGVKPEKSMVLRAVRRMFPITPDFIGQKFFARLEGRRAITPLFLVLLLVETTDLFFAFDSIPAVFGVTRKPFIVFTSNVFAILGLRSLYFVLAGAIGMFRYLKTGLSVVLLFIGAKMLLDPHDQPPHWYQIDLPDTLSLAVVVTIITFSILASVIVARRERRAADASPTSHGPP